jgi:integrase
MRRVIPLNNHGSIRIRFTHQGHRYSLSPGGRFDDRISLTFAWAIAARIELDIKAGFFDVTLYRYRSGGIVPPRVAARPKKLIAVWDEWVSTLGLSEETKADHYEMTRRMMEQARPSPTIDDAGWFTRVGAPLAASTYNKRLGYLRRCLKWAIAEGLATSTPYDRLKSRTAEKAQVKPFTAVEIHSIIQGFLSLSPVYAPFVGFLFLTGCRTSEAIGIQWKRIDFDRGEVTIADSLPKSPVTGKPVRKSTKTGAVPILAMNDELRALLEGLRRGAGDELVFPCVDGKPIDRHAFRKMWIKVLAHQGIEYRKPYTSRHTTASHAISQGMSMADVAYILGHRDSRMVSTTYGHIIDRPSLPDIRL